MNNIIKNRIKQKNGITLIALVITIIVLLILAGVSIAMLTGQNGILTQAQNAKTTTEDKSAEEKIKLAVMAARAQSEGALDADKLVAEITNNYGGTATKTGTGFPVNATVDGKSFTIDGDGNVTSTGSGNGPTGGTLGTVTGNEEKNTTVQDSLGNQVVVPAGFKVINPTENVTDGIVVEDVTHEVTKGSQFVWIPIGEVIKDSAGNKETIKLSRYTFADDNVGIPTEKGATEIEDSYESSYKHTETNTSTYENTTAKENIESEESGFRKSAKDNHGYYIGRYEARKNGTQVTVKASDTVYNKITQPSAAIVSRGMYEGTPFESDLINSYAWDTATLFLQKFDNRTDKTKPYSRQNSLNRTFVEARGTNNLADASKQDKICNIYDMASNCLEWTTETSSGSNYPCTGRGGVCNNSYTYTSYRSSNFATDSGDYGSFRLLLYL